MSSLPSLTIQTLGHIEGYLVARLRRASSVLQTRFCAVLQLFHSCARAANKSLWPVAWRYTNNGWAFFVVAITIIKININYGHYCLSGSLCCLLEVMSLSLEFFVFVFMCCICVFGAFSACGTEDALTNKRMTTMYAFGSNL